MEAAEATASQENRVKGLATWQVRIPALCVASRGLLLVAGDKEGSSRITSSIGSRASSEDGAPVFEEEHPQGEGEEVEEERKA